ncbi:ATP-dependent nuclease [Planctobacterium marinum]|uniref:ATP-dependent endonuclease n=1 Tax=Planctobacterium marinum TaxID=1631968 RepID=A0AA48I5A5_9ALTE|nr:ATP-dependent endonuclease [Planctobacterium marinum]
MKVDSFKLSGWRSYDLDGVSISGLRKINLIIGPNNSGKSNLSKYFNYLKRVAYNHLTVGKTIMVSENIDESQTWAWEKHEIKCEIKISCDNETNNNDKVFYKAEDNEVVLDCCHDIQLGSTFLKIKINNQLLFNEDNLIRPDLRMNDWVDPSSDVSGFGDNEFYWKKFLSSLVFVDPIRHHSRNSTNLDNHYFDGAKIIDELDELRCDKATPSNWSGYKKKMKLWLSEILSETVTNIDIVGRDLSFEFESDLHFSLEQLGTGVSQIVMLLSHLWINKDKNLNVFLEEPEANLHPEAVIKLVSIFEKEMTNHSFFITTHSPSLIDCINENWAVYRTLKTSSGASNITPNDNIIKYYETLDSLGVKASQILQSNTVIWVEGPSDRIYLNKWIHIFANGELKEGKDYSFLYFGGTNLASFTALEDLDEELINMLSTSRKAYLIADSDCCSQSQRNSETFKGYLNSMLERVNAAANKSQGVDSSLGDYFGIWVTEGREVENYLCKETLFEVLIDTGFKRNSIGKGENRKELKLHSSDASGFEFGKFDSFDEAISKCYKYPNNTQLGPTELNNIAGSYSNKKVAIAKAVVEKITRNNCSTFNLDSEMKKLVEFIRK